eukprot:548066_1
MSILLCIYALIIGIQSTISNIKLEESPMELHPEIVERVRKRSDCTDDQLIQIHKNCSSLVHQLIHIVYEYENMPRSRKYGMNPCERAQIACFTHKLWIDSAKCACSICNHIWFYDEEMHEHFTAYFKDHNCKGKIPNQMNKIQFCDFMNQTERFTPPNPCQKINDTDINMKPEAANNNINIDYLSNASNILYTNRIVIIWTIMIAITMSFSSCFTQLNTMGRK